MFVQNHQSPERTAIRTDLGAIFLSMELSLSTWLLTSLSPGAGEKMSKRSVVGGDVGALLTQFALLQDKAAARTGQRFPIIVIQEAGLDGFWIHRVLQSEGVESWVVDPASIATSRRKRRAKTDKLDGEALLRALLAYKRGEPRVCAMVKAPSPQEEDRRRICRERKALITERVHSLPRDLIRLAGSRSTDRTPPLASNAVPKNGPVFLSLGPSQAGYGCSRQERRPDVRWTGLATGSCHASGSDHRIRHSRSFSLESLTWTP